MKQTTDSPYEKPELSRTQQIEAKWCSLSRSEQEDLIHEFIAGLKMSYHKDFFKRLGPTKIISERWFLQYVENEYFKKDEE